MKLVVAVAVGAFCAVLQIASVGGSLATQLDTVNERVNMVTQVVADVRKLQYVDFFPRVLDFLTFGSGNISKGIDSHLNATVTQIEETVHNSVAAGKDPAACHTTANTSFETLRITMSRTFGSCFDIAQDWLHETTEALEANIREATRVLSYLNLIFPSCYTTDTADIESCVVQMLPNATEMVDTYKTTTTAYLTNVTHHDHPIEAQVAICMEATLLTMEKSQNNIKSDFDKCVAAL